MKTSINHSIFKPFPCLELRNKTIETIFKNNLITKATTYTKFLLIFNILVLIAGLILSLILSKENNNNEKAKFIGMFYIIVILLCMILIETVLFCVLSTKCSFLKKLNIIFNYFTFCIIFVLIRYIIYYSKFPNDFIHVFFYCDFLMKFIWIELTLIDFYENLIINVFIIILSKVIQTFIFGWSSYDIIIYLSVGDVLRISSVFFAYFILRKNRSLLFYDHTMKELNEWYRSVLDNLNNGFIKITNKELTFINKCAIEIEQKRGVIETIPEKGNYNEILHNKENAILNDLINGIILIHNTGNQNGMQPTMINNINNNSKLLNTTTHILNIQNEISTNSSMDENVHVATDTSIISNKMNIILDKIKCMLSSQKKENDDNNNNNHNNECSTPSQFVYLGTMLMIYHKDNHSHFEIYGRSYTNESGENIEIILNDVTRTQIEQEKNTEIRYKSTLLSKFAHEFKNPLICLTEIVEEEIEKMKSQNKKNFKLMKAISNYLLILIKDIDMFSQIQIEGCERRKLSLSQIKIKDICFFVEMISNYLIGKNRIDNRVKFQVISKNAPNLIFNDEIMIKQVLINLISNSIKFTTKGLITLTIEKDEKESDYVKFIIKDTGIGIPLDNQNELFTCFSKAKNNNGHLNKYGAGLGLTIAQEMSKLLGKPIEFESIEGKGSSFWFYVNINKHLMPKTQSSHTLNDSSTTIKLSEIPLNGTPMILNKEDILYSFGGENISSLSDTCNDNNSNSRELTILLADDEILIRNAMKRKILNYAEHNNININILEVGDGVEILYFIYQLILNSDTNNSNQKIDFIISDENMIYYSGRKTARKLRKLEKLYNYKHIPFFLASAIPFQINKQNNNSIVDGIFHKPLIDSDLEEMFNSKHYIVDVVSDSHDKSN